MRLAMMYLFTELATRGTEGTESDPPNNDTRLRFDGWVDPAQWLSARDREATPGRKLTPEDVRRIEAAQAKRERRAAKRETNKAKRGGGV